MTNDHDDLDDERTLRCSQLTASPQAGVSPSKISSKDHLHLVNLLALDSEPVEVRACIRLISSSLYNPVMQRLVLVEALLGNHNSSSSSNHRLTQCLVHLAPLLLRLQVSVSSSWLFLLLLHILRLSPGGFGSTNTSNSGGLFGAPKPATGFGAFGGGTSTFGGGTGGMGSTAAGTSTGTGLFGTQNTGGTNAFGSGLFGNAKPATNTFGSTTREFA